MINHIQKSHIVAWKCYEKSMVQRTRTGQLLREKTVAQSSLPNPFSLDYHHGHEAWMISHSFSRAIQSQPKQRLAALRSKSSRESTSPKEIRDELAKMKAQYQTS